MNAKSRSKAHRIVVRRAEVRDADAFAATFSQPIARAGTLQVPYPSPDAWRKRLAETSPDDFILVAEVDGIVVGNLGLHAAKSHRRKHVGAVGISVHDAWHRHGVGSALLTAAVDLADNWVGYTRIELTVYTDNAAALALYRKFGFVVEGTHREFALRNGHYVDAYAMARIVPGPARVAVQPEPAPTARTPAPKKPLQKPAPQKSLRKAAPKRVA